MANKIILIFAFIFSSISFCQSGIYSIGNVKVVENGKRTDTWTNSGKIIVREKKKNKVLFIIRYGDYKVRLKTIPEYLEKHKKIFYYNHKFFKGKESTVTFTENSKGEKHIQLYTDDELKTMLYFQIMNKEDL